MPQTPRRKILFLPKWYPDRKQDQNGNFIQQHAYAVSKFADVVVLFANHDDFSGPNLTEFDFKKDDGIPTFYFYYKQRITGLNFIDKPLKLILYFSCLFRGYRIIERLYGRPDLLHVHVLLRTGLFAWFKSFAAGLPYIITEHWTLYLPHNASKISFLRKWLSKMVVKKAAAVHTVSQDLKHAMQGLGFQNRNYTVIPNVVNTATFYPENATVLKPKRQLLNVAILNDRAKNQSGLIKAFHKLLPEFPDLELRIIGFGPSEKALKNLAQELGLLNKTVFFEGKKEAAEVAAFMRRADVFVLPSFYETFGVVLIEALASGTPVIASKVGGVPEVFGKEHGILIEPGNEDELLTALRFVLQNPEAFPKGELREFAEKYYSFEAVGKQFAALYETVLFSTEKLPNAR
ncbi:glycosyltransferase [Adhaeribacter sp. BT258]|uniref:Glycosyltransferase n=1 Tax=Adhaeribacter terrigena TaxID=2793070 RepID=A0ABS1C5N8_9BACT|nr:glycosyltransferase [Adhaeribacter terrigena]MBK0404497.1 glycosyltransferase [Adhaeribacter terrigena]